MLGACSAYAKTSANVVPAASGFFKAGWLFEPLILNRNELDSGFRFPKHAGLLNRNEHEGAKGSNAGWKSIAVFNAGRTSYDLRRGGEHAEQDGKLNVFFVKQ